MISTRARWAALVCLALPLAACGGGGDSGQSSDAANSPAVTSVDPASVSGTLTYWDTSDATNEAPAFKAAIADFEKKYPKVKINYQSVPFGDAQNKFKTAAAAKSGAPDVLRAEVAWVSEFASLGYLYELDGSPLTADSNDFNAAAWGSTQYNGHTYGIPQVTDTLGLMYNKKILNDAGVSVPTTWDEVKTAAAKIKSSTNKTGFYMNPAGYYLLPFIYGEGGDLLNTDEKKITVNSPEAIKGVEIAQGLTTAEGTVKPPSTDAYTAMMKAFTGGEVGMIIQGPWETANVTKSSAFGGADNLGVATVPSGSAKKGGPVGGHNYVVYSGMSQDKAAAVEAFVGYMASAEVQAQIADKLGLLPTRTSAYAKVTNQTVAAWQPTMEVAVPRAWIPEGGKLFPPLDEAASKIFVQNVNVKTALDAVAATYKSQVVPSYSN